jgi:hypothetical protein
LICEDSSASFFSRMCRRSAFSATCGSLMSRMISFVSAMLRSTASNTFSACSVRMSRDCAIRRSATVLVAS